MKSKRVPSKHLTEIPGVLRYPDGREECMDNAAGNREYKDRTVRMTIRQGFRCAGCEAKLVGLLTFGHQCSRGGGRREDRIEIDEKWHNAALCGKCNSSQGSQRYEWDYSTGVPKWVPVNKAFAA